MRHKLQLLRDEAERNCLASAEAGDRDSADAWERIGIAIDECQQSIALDCAKIESRLGLFAVRHNT